jgi:tetratricopeptide (TPR) repeat protein
LTVLAERLDQLNLLALPDPFSKGDSVFISPQVRETTSPSPGRPGHDANASDARLIVDDPEGSRLQTIQTCFMPFLTSWPLRLGLIFLFAAAARVSAQVTPGEFKNPLETEVPTPQGPVRPASLTKPAPDAPKPFFSGVKETKYEDRMFGTVLAPEAGAVTHLWYDVPYAVHVPFEVPFQGKAVRVFYDVQVIWDQAVKNPDINDPGFPQPHTYGVHRMDGKSLRERSVFYERGTDTKPSEWKPLWFDTGAPVPTWMHVQPPPEIEVEKLPTRNNMDQPPFHGTSSAPPRLVLDQPEPGWYVFWFSVYHWSYDDWVQYLDAETVGAKFRVSLVVTPVPSTLADEESQYLFAEKPRPPRMPPDESYRAITHEIPVTLHRDGWVFDRLEVVANDTSILKRRVGNENNFADIEASSSVNGPQASLSLKNAVTDRGVLALRESGTWEITFPASLSDGNVADVVVKGTEQHEVLDQERATWPPFKVNWFANQSSPSSEFSWEVDMVTTNTDEAVGDALDDAVRGVAGKAAAEGWRLQPTTRRDVAPGDGEPLRFRYYARLPYDYRWKNAGSVNLMDYYLGPWKVSAFYKRKKDAAPAAPGGPTGPPGTQIIVEHDPFWDWYPEFSKKVRELRAAYNEARLTAAVAGMALQGQKRDNRYLQTMLNDPEYAITERGKALFQKRIEEIDRQRHESRAKIDEAAGKATAAITGILQELRSAQQRFGAKHPELSDWEQPYKVLEDVIPLEFALSEGDPDVLRKALELAEKRELPARARLYEAEVRRKTGDSVGAVAALRRALEDDPEDPQVQHALRELESEFLRNALEKAQGSMTAARKAFFDYLEERGYKQDTVKKRSVYIPIIDLDRETAWAIFTTGVGGILAGFMDKAGALEELVSSKQHELARAFMGLHALVYMRERGYTFDEIRNMKSERDASTPAEQPTLPDAFPVKSSWGKPYTTEQFRNLGVMIREAMQLPDVAALVSGDTLKLRQTAGLGYWDPADIGSSTLEYVLDITSIKNLTLLLLPTTVAGVSGTTGRLFLSRAAMTEVAHAKSMQTGSEVLARLVGWNRALEALATTGPGKYLVTTLQNSHQFSEGLTGIQSAAWTIQRVVAAIVIQGLSMHYAEKYGGPEAALAMEMLLLLAGDMDLLYKLIGARDIPVAQIEGLIERRMLPALENKVAHMDELKGKAEGLQKIVDADKVARSSVGDDVLQLEAALREARMARDRVVALFEKMRTGSGTLRPDELLVLQEALGPGWKRLEQVRRIIERRARGEALEAAEYAILEREYGVNWRGEVPDGDAAHDMLIAYNNAIEAWIAGRRDGSEKAVQILREELERQAAKVAEGLENARGLAAAVKGRSIQKVKPPPPPDHYKLLDGFVDPTGVLDEAHELMLKGDFETALTKLDDVRAKLAQELPSEEFAALVKAIERRAEVCQQLKGVTKALPTEASRAFAEAIDDPNIGPDLLRIRDQWIRIGDESIDKVFKSPDGQYIIKIVHEAPVEGRLVNAELEGELVAAEFARELGITVPGVTAHIDEAGQAYVISRRLPDDAKVLAELEVGEMFSHHKELARHRALTVFLGDFDRHLNNYMVTKDGRLFAIDQGNADPRGFWQKFFDRVYPGEASLDGSLGRDHWFQRYHLGEGKTPQETRNGIIYETFLTYNEAEDVTNRIVKWLTTPAGETELREVLARAYRKLARGSEAEAAQMVDEAVRHLKAYNDDYEEAMRKLNQRNGISLPGSSGSGAAPLRPDLTVRLGDPHAAVAARVAVRRLREDDALPAAA